MTDLDLKPAPWWCRLFHNNVSRPVSGAFECYDCLKKYRCDWDPQKPESPKPETTEVFEA